MEFSLLSDKQFSSENFFARFFDVDIATIPGMDRISKSSALFKLREIE